jgi:TPR repeat protein
MNKSHTSNVSFGKRLGLVTALLLSGIAVCAHADDDQLNNPEVQKTLRAMKDTSTWYHPDLFGEFAGMRYYAKHQYREAMKYLEIGAYYADKLSQLSIGLMYMNGEGVEKDPATALAWFDIAAERGYPNFVATRDGLKAQLSAEQLAKSAEIRKTLEARYADAAAKPRMAMQLHQGQMQITGSRTGFDSGVSQLNTGIKSNQVAIAGGTDVYAKNRWDPDSYFKTRDAEWKATVTVGALESVAKSNEQPAAGKTDTQPKLDQ